MRLCASRHRGEVTQVHAAMPVEQAPPSVELVCLTRPARGLGCEDGVATGAGSGARGGRAACGSATRSVRRFNSRCPTVATSRGNADDLCAAVFADELLGVVYVSRQP